jgi:hypothetical protein
VIAHLLIPDEPTPTVTYETFFALHDVAEQMAVGLYCDRGKPRFPKHQPDLARHATVFWDTYFAGMACHDQG